MKSSVFGRLAPGLAGVALLLSAGDVVASEMGHVAANQVDLASYRAFLDDWLFTHVGDNRGPTGPDLAPARSNIQQLMASYGLTVTVEPFTYNSVTYRNVVGTKTGMLYPDQEIVIGAHYDSVSNPGADDNASGTALVLEAARIISQYESAYTIRFVAFSMEEVGLVGSYAYTDAHAGDDIIAMISADMVAHDTGTDVARVYGRTGSAVVAGLTDAIQEYGDGLTTNFSGWISASDHAPFDAAGFDACLLIEGEVWNNPYYHSQQDSFEQPGNLDFEYAVKMVRSMVGYLVDNAEVLVYTHNGDVNGDGLVNLVDHSAFATCLAGPAGVPDPPAPMTAEKCLGIFDFDADGDVDLRDVSVYVTVFGVGDCNGNGISDQDDIDEGVSADCNANAIPDECDVYGGTSFDCQSDNVPDECQLMEAPYFDSVARDSCADAEPICPDFTYTGSTDSFSPDGAASCGSSSSTPDAWYAYTPATSGAATFSLCNGTDYDSVMSVHTACPGGTANELDCDDDGCGQTGVPSIIEHSVSAGQTYWIRISGWSGSTGDFGLTVTGPDCLRPDNDCNNNGVPDECDIASGQSADTNGNGVPDECE